MLRYLYGKLPISFGTRMRVEPVMDEEKRWQLCAEIVATTHQVYGLDREDIQFVL